MEEDIKARVSSYIELLNTMKEQLGDGTEALAILHEIMKDIRSEKMQKKKVYNMNGPATERQIAYLKKLGAHIPENLSCQRASELIGEAQKWQQQVKQALRQPIRIA